MYMSYGYAHIVDHVDGLKLLSPWVVGRRVALVDTSLHPRVLHPVYYTLSEL